MKRRIYDIIQIGYKGDFPSRFFDIFISGVIILNILAMLLQTFNSLSPAFGVFEAIEFITVGIFIVEYILRIWTADLLYPKKGFFGSVLATLGVILPSFLIILLISFFLDRFLEIKWVASAFKGIKIAVGLLILDAAVKMILKMKKKLLPIIILSVAFIAMMLINIFALRISTIVLMLASAFIGLSAYLIKRYGHKEELT